jgi:enterochelin esterase-like enzyme
MCRRHGYLAIVALMMGIGLAACSGQGSGSSIPHAVESAQARVISITPTPRVDPTIEPPCSDEPPDNFCLANEAAQASVQLETQTVKCEELHGRIERRSYPGVLSGEEIPVMVYLPPCYDPYLKVYPVLFLLHGKPQDERHWLILGIDKIVDLGIAEGTWPPFIMVMPKQPEPLFTQSDGGPGSLEQEIMQGLIPYVLDRLPMTGEGARWAIAGVSRGGVWALEIGFGHADQFHRVAALSPALNVNYARPVYDPMQMLADATRVPEGIFLGAGTTDSARVKTVELNAIIENIGVRSHYLEVPGNHESATWIGLIPDMLFFLTEGW